LAKENLGAASDAFGEAVAALAGRNGSGYDLIHAHYWRSGIAALPAALELGLPFVQSFHTLAVMKNRALAPGDSPEPEVRIRSESFLSSQADALIAGSATEAAELIDVVGAPAGKVWVVPPGVDTRLFTPARAISESLVRGRLRVDNDRPILVVAGRVQPLKGQELAIAALAAMSASPRPLLVIAGEPTPGAERYASELRELASMSGIEDDVRFTGALEREPLADLLAAASLVLVPSRSETFGLVALEAAASGTPVLATGALGRTGAVAVGQSGVLLGSRDPGEWGKAITGLLADRLLLGELAASARDHAQNFSWAASAAGLLGIYASLSDKPPTGP
jgi:D-inositol-3-phosphate glycosyltransferase